LTAQIANGETPDVGELINVLSLELWLAGGGEEALKAGIEHWTDVKRDIPMWATSWNDPLMEQLRNTEWYKMLMVRTGLVDYWRERGWPDYCQPTSEYDFQCGEYRPGE
jgi:hypothetical protein